jgi:hypothetical protein
VRLEEPAQLGVRGVERKISDVDLLAQKSPRGEERPCPFDKGVPRLSADIRFGTSDDGVHAY